jgi:hypothetical protein
MPSNRGYFSLLLRVLTLVCVALLICYSAPNTNKLPARAAVDSALAPLPALSSSAGRLPAGPSEDIFQSVSSLRQRISTTAFVRIADPGFQPGQKLRTFIISTVTEIAFEQLEELAFFIFCQVLHLCENLK